MSTDILNPNMQEVSKLSDFLSDIHIFLHLQIVKDDSKSFPNMIWTTLSIYRNNVVKENKKIRENLQVESNQTGFGQTFIHPDCIEKVSKATRKEWNDFLHKQLSRFEDDKKTNPETDKFKIKDVEKEKIRSLLKAFTDPDVISLIHSKLVNNK